MCHPAVCMIKVIKGHAIKAEKRDSGRTHAMDIYMICTLKNLMNDYDAKFYCSNSSYIAVHVADFLHCWVADSM